MINSEKLMKALEGFVEKKLIAINSAIKSAGDEIAQLKNDISNGFKNEPVLEALKVIDDKVKHLEENPAKDGKDGQDADATELEQLLDQAKKLSEDNLKLFSDKLDEKTKEVSGLQEKIADFQNQIKELSKNPAKDGKDGKDGPSIEQIKIEISQEVQKIFHALELPKDGRDGRDGSDGMDALDIEFLPAINENKKYSRGTYAIHKGGIWKTHANTDGMKGWECLVDGISDININYDGERTFEISAEKSSGQKVVKSFVMPVVIDRGVFRDEAKYCKNDGVTHGGSYWLVQKDSPEGSPGASKDFRLSVKAGRNAKEKVKI